MVVDIGSVPLLDGARHTINDGILSSLHPQNAQGAAEVDGAEAASQHPLWPILFDPQTGTCLLQPWCGKHCLRPHGIYRPCFNTESICVSACLFLSSAIEGRMHVPQRRMLVHVQAAVCWRACPPSDQRHALKPCALQGTTGQPSLAKSASRLMAQTPPLCQSL